MWVQMVRIVREFQFEAAHQLEGHDGDCANIHGHSYRLQVGLLGEPSAEPGPKEGFVLDFKDLKSAVKRTFLDAWDHSFLAKGDETILPALESSGTKLVKLGFRATAENMCRHILKLLCGEGLPVEFVRLYETATSYAEANVRDIGLTETSAFDIDETAALPVSEIFGPTIQGEGMLTGQKTLFLRMYGCDNKCSWCDSKYAWDEAERARPMTIRDIADNLERLEKKSGARHLTLTGGNPCIHTGSAMADLIRLLSREGFVINVETQGTILPDWIGLVSYVTLSPKPPSSGNPTGTDALGRFARKLELLSVPFSFKAVVFDSEDYEYFKGLYRRYPGSEYPWFVQPGNPGTDGELDLKESVENYEALCERVISDPELTHVRVLPQLHTWLWGNEREV